MCLKSGSLEADSKTEVLEQLRYWVRALWRKGIRKGQVGKEAKQWGDLGYSVVSVG